MKQKAKIAILDAGSQKDTKNDLLKILKSSPDLDIHLWNSSFKDGGSDWRKLDYIGLSINPDCLFIIISKCNLPMAKGMLRPLIITNSDIPIILVIEAYNPSETYSLLKLDIADFITSPFSAIDVLPRLWRILENRQQLKTTVHKFKKRLGLNQLVGKSQIFLDVVNMIPTVAKCDASVMISGETGTGKELVSRAIHYLSPRSTRPFVPINCGAIPADLLENELFGHVQGAFTGATTSHSGLVFEAEKGTLFLDDIACLSITSQAKLLRFLQEKEYRQLGTAKIFQSDTRVIATTNIDLDEAVSKGMFRQDLYYRLNTLPLSLPSLRDRLEDIPILARHFLDKYSIKHNKKITDFSSGAIKKLVLYDWPGNVRELVHIIERAVIFCKGETIEEANIINPREMTTSSLESFQKAKSEIIKNFEMNYISGLLLAYQGNITKAAQAAQKNRRAFWQLIRKHHINVDNFKHR